MRKAASASCVNRDCYLCSLMRNIVDSSHLIVLLTGLVALAVSFESWRLRGWLSTDVRCRWNNAIPSLATSVRAVLVRVACSVGQINARCSHIRSEFSELLRERQSTTENKRRCTQSVAHVLAWRACAADCAGVQLAAAGRYLSASRGSCGARAKLTFFLLADARCEDALISRARSAASCSDESHRLHGVMRLQQREAS